MSKPVEQALTGLVPSLNGPPPPELLSVAVALLAQSRSKASSLKPDEEIARTYACAHLACERLKQRLNLPPIVPRPPIPPRAYKKVFAYFDSALTIFSSSSSSSSRPPSAPQTPSKRARAAADAATPTSSKRTPAPTMTTPSRTPTTRAARTPTSARKKAEKAGAGDDDDDDEDGLPAYAMPLIRRLCRALDAPAAVPHVYAGVRSVMREGGDDGSAATRTKRGRGRGARGSLSGGVASGVEEADVPVLVVAVLLYVLVRLSGRETDAREHRARRGKAVGVLRGMEVCAGRGDEELVEGVERLLVEARERGWLEMEWFGNVVEGAGLGVDGVADEQEGLEMEDYARTPKRTAVASANAYTPLKKRRVGDGVENMQAAVSQGGLGTMMQDKVDYLSEARRAQFSRWKTRIMKRVEQIEREDGQAMDVSA